MKPILLLAFLFLSNSLLFAQTFHSGDVNALIKIKAQTKSNLNWIGSTPSDTSAWEGVTWTDVNQNTIFRVTKLDLENKSLVDTLDLRDLHELVEVNARKNNLNEVFLSNLSKLSEIIMNSVTTLKSLNLLGLTSLEKLDIEHNSIENLDVINLNNLRYLYARKNKLTTIHNINHLGALEVIDLYDNQLTDTLDFSNSNYVRQIALSSNKIKHVVFPNTPTLEDIDVANNEIDSIDFSSIHTNLRSIRLQYNQLNKLGVNSSYDKLTIFDCSDNRIPFSELKKILELDPTNEWNETKLGDNTFYFNQDSVFDKVEIKVGDIQEYIDEEYLGNPTEITQFSWTKNGTPVTEGTDYTKSGNYSFVFNTPGEYICTMKNAALPNVDVITSVVKVKEVPLITSWPTIPIIEVGKSLPDTLSSIGHTAVAGKFVFIDVPVNFKAEAGYHIINAKFIPENKNKYSEVNGTIAVNGKKTPIITWPTLDSITYTQKHKDSRFLITTAPSVTGDFKFKNDDLVPNQSGNILVDVIFTPDDTTYIEIENKLDLYVKKAIPNITTWATAEERFYDYGLTLSDINLKGGQSLVIGTYKFVNKTDKVNAGISQQNIKFIPTDTSYTILKNTVDVSIKKVDQTISWNTHTDLEIKKGDSLTLNLSTDSNLPLIITANPDDAVSINGKIIIGIKAGKVALTVNQAGDEKYNPASSITKDLTIEDKVLTNTKIQEQILRISPNPSKGVIRIKNATKGELIKIYDMSGSLVFEKLCLTKTEIINLGELEFGLYVLELKNERVRFQIK